MITSTSETGDSSARPMVVDLPRQSSFHLKVGTYTASIRSVNIRYRQSANDSIPHVRFLFGVETRDKSVDYLAKIDFKLDLREDSDLWNVLSRLIGRKQLQAANGKFDLNALVGLRCDIVVDHVYVDPDTYDFPLVVITDIQPEGTLIQPPKTEGK